MKKRLMTLLLCGAFSLAGCGNSEKAIESDENKDEIKVEELNETGKIKVNSSYTAFDITKDELKQKIEESTGSSGDYYPTEAGNERIDITDTLIAEVATSTDGFDIESLSFIILNSNDESSANEDLIYALSIYNEFDGFSQELFDTALSKYKEMLAQHGLGVGEAIKDHIKLSFTILKSEEDMTTLLILAPTPDADSESVEETEKAPDPVKTDDALTENTQTSQNSESDQKTETAASTETKTETPGQKNAYKSAQNYLSFSAFSRSGLIEQLEYEGYSTEDATYAVDKANPDWNEQAYKSAQNYLSFSSFSESGLIEQLEFEGFTPEQAQYGVSKAYYE